MFIAEWIAAHPDLVAGVVALVLIGFGALGARRILGRARAEAARLAGEARLEAESRANEILVSAQEKALSLEEEADRRQQELDQRETAIDARARESETVAGAVEKEQRELERRGAALARSEERAKGRLDEAEALLSERRAALERVAGLTVADAKAELIASVEESARREAVRAAKRAEEEVRETARREALRIVVQATQRIPIREVVESSVTFIGLPSDEMKGRIIGREGRNIRALEHATGIDVIVDDTPSAILVSSFDPVRREVARLAIEKLVEDGRIHPARIEETVEKIREELETHLEGVGQEAVFGLGLPEIPGRLARLLGRTKLRYHHGQNLLQHAFETALVASHMAAEFGGREEIARRAGLLHEIGRVDESATGHPILASADLAGRHGEREDVVHAIQALHPDVEPRTVEALLLRTANRVSENRPGARKDNLDVFIERMRHLETIAARFPSVSRAYAVKAGKELRVIVDTASSTDGSVAALSREIARAIEREADFPGEVRVAVVRESRAVRYAV